MRSSLVKDCPRRGSSITRAMRRGSIPEMTVSTPFLPPQISSRQQKARPGKGRAWEFGLLQSVSARSAKFTANLPTCARKKKARPWVHIVLPGMRSELSEFVN